MLENVLEVGQDTYREKKWYDSVPEETQVFLLQVEENGQFQEKCIRQN